MAIFKLYDDDSVYSEDSDSHLDEKVQNIKTCKKLFFWKSLGLRCAFLLASLFCIVWFLRPALAYLCWTIFSYIPSKARFIAIKNRAHHWKSLNLTMISFFGCMMASISPHLGLPFLSAYFGLFTKDFSKEAIHLDELIAKVKRLSA